MKKSGLLLLSLVFSMVVKAQVKSNVILFTDNGEKFTAIMNGLRMNEEPATHVKMTDLTGEFYKLKVIFADPALGESSFNLNLSMNMGMETTCNITKNKKGNYVLRYMGSVPLAEAAPPPPGTETVVYSENLPPESAVVTHEVTTTTTQTGTTDNVSLNMGVNMGGTGAGVNINISGMDPNLNSSQTTVTHTTTTTTTTTSGTPLPPPPPPSPAPPSAYLPGYTGPIGCPIPISPGEFAELKQSISSKSFEESKMTIAKQVVANSCLLTSQVKELMLLFSFEDSRLDLAKFAYGRTYDIGNYYKVNDAFTFESSIDELNQYIMRGR
ncbi:MAG: DUF4476 domain-containing protein [Bacteroidia bacterium]|nr:DUF4476 domain-containing protein [Bacteroidia bacterium]MCZ2277271.1 DUF4476 domain-containing protein [Bacteroidia bacterium]